MSEPAKLLILHCNWADRYGESQDCHISTFE